jgi:serine/threonine-protein kinase
MNIGRFEVIERLAVGNVAEVYLAQEPTADPGQPKRVVIKRLLAEKAGETIWHDRVVAEGRLGALCHHPGIGGTVEVGQADGLPYVVVEFLEGGTLEQALATASALPSVEVTVYLMRQLLDALEHVHTRTDETGEEVGLVHRDICPANIMILPSGRLALFDFGIAVRGGRTDTYDPGIFAGRPAYVAPEAARGNAVDARADVWSAGVVFWEMLVGKRLFYREDIVQTLSAVTSEPIRPPSHLRKEVHRALDNSALRALSREPAGRYPSAARFEADLAGWARLAGREATDADVAQWAVS